MRYTKLTIFILFFIFGFVYLNKAVFAQQSDLAQTPPMGWNSWNCFGIEVNEEKVNAVADYMAENLKKHGWEYVVIDAGWYHPPTLITRHWSTDDPPQSLDSYGRLLPDTVKFPSAAGGKGFKPLADYVHSKGLKFGIHIMRGIPWNAYENDLPLKNTSYTAKDIGDTDNVCQWAKVCVGIDMDHPAGQQYYNTIFEMYAEWGVDYVKVDDVAREFHSEDIIAMNKAIENSGRPMVLSLSPGPSQIEHAGFFKEQANLYRISNDFWDHWKFVKRNMEYCVQWYPHITPGHWPDADMLTFGKLRVTGGDDWVASLLEDSYDNIGNEYSRFTDTEKQTVMTLWSIFRSPLMFGGYLPETKEYTLSLIQNDSVIKVNQNSTNNRLVDQSGYRYVWSADEPGTDNKYVALFNLYDSKQTVEVGWSDLDIQENHKVKCVWKDSVYGVYNQKFVKELEPHASLLLKFLPTDEDITMIHEHQKGNINVFPNPCDKQLIVRFEEFKERQVKILDLHGTLLFEKYSPLTKQEVFDVRKLKPGLYVVKIIGDGHARAKHFIKH